MLVVDLAPAATARRAGARADRAEREGARRGACRRSNSPSQSVEAALRACDFDPRELERCEERLFALRGMARKYCVAGRRAAGARREIRRRTRRRSTTGRAPRRTLEQASCAPPRRAMPPPPRAVAGARRRAAERARGRRQRRNLPPLKLERARFIVEIDERRRALISADGYDRVEFVVQTNPGSRPGPLMKVASGGELARFHAGAEGRRWRSADSAPTLVFDEIDTGVGGAVADAIGQRLARLATRAQVLAVTHAPQVAARSQRHFRIAKDESARRRVATRVHGARRRRAARGDRPHAGRRRDHREARAAAKSLIEKAGIATPGKLQTPELTLLVRVSCSGRRAAQPRQGAVLAKILIVEDIEQIAEMLVERLERRGHAVLVSTDPRPLSERQSFTTQTSSFWNRSCAATRSFAPRARSSTTITHGKSPSSP